MVVEETRGGDPILAAAVAAAAAAAAAVASSAARRRSSCRSLRASAMCPSRGCGGGGDGRVPQILIFSIALN